MAGAERSWTGMAGLDGDGEKVVRLEGWSEVR